MQGINCKKATLLKHQMKFMMMLSMMKLIRREGYESKKETEFINSAHYAAIAAWHFAKESHYETATIITKTAEKNKPLVITKKNQTKRRYCSKIVLCLSVVMIIVVIASCVCFTLEFLEISRLKSEISSLQKVTATTWKCENIAIEMVDIYVW